MKIKNISKRTLSIFLALIMLVTSLPLSFMPDLLSEMLVAEAATNQTVSGQYNITDSNLYLHNYRIEYSKNTYIQPYYKSLAAGDTYLGYGNDACNLLKKYFDERESYDNKTSKQQPLTNSIPVYRITRSSSNLGGGYTDDDVEIHYNGSINISNYSQLQNQVNNWYEENHINKTLSAKQAQMITSVLYFGQKQYATTSGQDYYNQNAYAMATQALIWEIEEGKRIDWDNSVAYITTNDGSTYHSRAANAQNRSNLVNSYSSTINESYRYYWHDYYYTQYNDYFKDNGCPDYYQQIIDNCENYWELLEFNVGVGTIVTDKNNVNQSHFNLKWSLNASSSLIGQMNYKLSTDEYSFEMKFKNSLIGSDNSQYNPDYIILPVTQTVLENVSDIKLYNFPYGLTTQNSNVVTGKITIEGISANRKSYYVYWEDLNGITGYSYINVDDSLVKKAVKAATGLNTITSPISCDYSTGAIYSKVEFITSEVSNSVYNIMWFKTPMDINSQYNNAYIFDNIQQQALDASKKSRLYASAGNVVPSNIYFKLSTDSCKVTFKCEYTGDILDEFYVPKGSLVGRAPDICSTHEENGIKYYHTSKWIDNDGTAYNAYGLFNVKKRSVQSDVVFVAQVEQRGSVNFVCAQCGYTLERYSKKVGEDVTVPSLEKVYTHCNVYHNGNYNTSINKYNPDKGYVGYTNGIWYIDNKCEKIADNVQCSKNLIITEEQQEYYVDMREEVQINFVCSYENCNANIVIHNNVLRGTTLSTPDFSNADIHNHVSSQMEFVGWSLLDNQISLNDDVNGLTYENSIINGVDYLNGSLTANKSATYYAHYQPTYGTVNVHYVSLNEFVNSKKPIDELTNLNLISDSAKHETIVDISDKKYFSSVYKSDDKEFVFTGLYYIIDTSENVEEVTSESDLIVDDSKTLNGVSVIANKDTPTDVYLFYNTSDLLDINVYIGANHINALKNDNSEYFGGLTVKYSYGGKDFNVSTPVQTDMDSGTGFEYNGVDYAFSTHTKIKISTEEFDKFNGFIPISIAVIDNNSVFDYMNEIECIEYVGNTINVYFVAYYQPDIVFEVVDESGNPISDVGINVSTNSECSSEILSTTYENIFNGVQDVIAGNNAKSNLISDKELVYRLFGNKGDIETNYNTVYYTDNNGQFSYSGQVTEVSKGSGLAVAFYILDKEGVLNEKYTSFDIDVSFNGHGEYISISEKTPYSYNHSLGGYSFTSDLKNIPVYSYCGEEWFYDNVFAFPLAMTNITSQKRGVEEFYCLGATKITITMKENKSPVTVNIYSNFEASNDYKLVEYNNINNNMREIELPNIAQEKLSFKEYVSGEGFSSQDFEYCSSFEIQPEQEGSYSYQLFIIGQDGETVCYFIDNDFDVFYEGLPIEKNLALSLDAVEESYGSFLCIDITTDEFVDVQDNADSETKFYLYSMDNVSAEICLNRNVFQVFKIDENTERYMFKYNKKGGFNGPNEGVSLRVFTKDDTLVYYDITGYEFGNVKIGNFWFNRSVDFHEGISFDNSQDFYSTIAQNPINSLESYNVSGSSENNIIPLYNNEFSPSNTSLKIRPNSLYIKVDLSIERKLEEEFNVQFIEPSNTDGYTFGTDVVSTFMVTNEADVAYTNTYPLDATFTPYVEYTVNGNSNRYPILTAEKTMVLPATTDENNPQQNIVYYRWAVPDEATLKETIVNYEKTQNSNTITVEDVTLNSVIPYLEVMNRSTTIPFNVETLLGADGEKQVKLVNPIDSTTPYDGHNLDGGEGYTYKAPTADKEYYNTAIWEEWIYEDGEFVKLTNKATLGYANNLLTPDINNPSQAKQEGVWVTKSGYALNTQVTTTSVVTSSSNIITNTSCTPAQTGVVYFPENNYSVEQNKFDNLILNKADNYFCFKTFDNGSSSGDKHFIPVWYPDGDYITQTMVSDMWTPVGKLNYLGKSNAVQIKGSLFDDYNSSQKTF